MLTAAFVVVTTGCGSSEASSEPKSEAAEPSSTEVAETPETRVLSEGEWTVKNVTIEDRVVGLNGEAAAEEARELTLQLVQDFGFNEQSVKYVGKQGKAESRPWMLSARQYMTAGAAADWTRTVNAYFREKKLDGTEAYDDMMSLTHYGIYGDSMLPDDLSLPLMFNPTVRNLEVDLSSDGRMWVTVRSSADFNYVNNGDAAQTRMTRDQEFWLEEVGGVLKVDGWHGTIDAKAIS